MRTAGPSLNGKIQKAVWITESYPEEIEADLQRYYGLAFADLFRKDSGLTWRKLLVLINHLPPEGTLNTAIRNNTPEERLVENAGDPTEARWSTTETLLATLIDEVRINSWLYERAHSDHQIPKPEPIKRPGVNVRKRHLRVIDMDRAQRMDPRLRGLSAEEAQMKLNEMTGRG